EEIGSPNFPEVVLAPKVRAALSRTVGLMMPEAGQELDGTVAIELGSKGDIELDLIASGEKWGRGPTRDVHSSYAARIDQPAWRLVQALNTMVTPTGEPAIDGFFDNVKPLSAAEQAMLDIAARREFPARDRRCSGAANAHHRRPRRRLHGSGRQDDPAAQDDRKDRHAT